MSIRTNILMRVYLAFGLILLLALAVVIQLFRVQFVQGPKWRAMAKELSTRYMKVEAARGNIFSVDGSLLATSVPEYELHMDMLAGGIADDKIFYSKVDSLAQSLSKFFGDKSAREYAMILRDARRDSSRYQLIRRKVTYQELKKIRQFPIFNMGKYKGGLVVVQKNRRILPFRALAARTIGYKNENVKNPVGLEGAYAEYINGENGQRLMQRIAGGVWMPVNEEEEIAPRDGADIISTIDVNFQDVAQNALEKQLIKSEADHGCVILMEVATGEVRAVANFSKVAPGEYKEQFNYAIAGNQDPGSTFKLASYMAMIEDHKVDTSTRVATGTYHIPGHDIKDSHGSIGVVSVKRAFEESSNAAVAYLINKSYKDNPFQFTNHLYDWGLNQKLGLQIPGEATPVVKNPKNRSWNKNMTLPQMAYGYEMQLTPLKMLSFYNAVANNGKYVAPIFVREIKRLGNTIEQFHARVINPKICSDRTEKIMREMLEGVVTEGTGKGIVYNPLYKVAGKTGTAQVADANKGYKAKKQYQASFCGYFPADKPKYSLIVVVNDPKHGYYAAEVAGPVFREIADKVYSSDLEINQQPSIKFAATPGTGTVAPPSVKVGNGKALKQIAGKLGVRGIPLSDTSDSDEDTTERKGTLVARKRSTVVPSVIGMDLSDAIYKMGNAGYKVAVRGSGVVKSQSVTGGSIIPKGAKITIELE